MFNTADTYQEAEDMLIREILLRPDFITTTTFEIIQHGFRLNNPLNNANNHSDYMYAEKFFQWMLSGEEKISQELLDHNPWVKRFVDATGLPEDFSSSYGWKIKKQLITILAELKRDHESRRAYLDILIPRDLLILGTKTTHEFPCTIGFHLMIRNEKLHMIVNMRSNNIYSVMPYDVYNFTRLQAHVSDLLGIKLGYYYHQINNAHLYKGDVRRLRESLFLTDKNKTDDTKQQQTTN